MPVFFQAVGQYYEDFLHTYDDEVRELLAIAAQEMSRAKTTDQQ
jgi:predicted phosphoribosyltransferase